MSSKLSGFFRGLVGTKPGAAGDAASAEAVEYKGYAIRPDCRKQGAQWLTAGVISKTFDDGVKEHRFIRADVHASKDDAEACAVGKAKRIIEEQGDRMFKED